MHGIHRKAFAAFLQGIHERGLIVWIVVMKALSECWIIGYPICSAAIFAAAWEGKALRLDVLKSNLPAQKMYEKASKAADMPA